MALILTAVVLALLALLAGVVLGRRVTAPTEALTRRGRAAGPGRFRHLDPHRRPRRDRPARAHHGRHAPQPHRPHRHAAPARGRGAGRARAHRRRRLCRRRGAQYPLSERRRRACSASRRSRPSASSAAMCSSPRPRIGSASLRHAARSCARARRQRAAVEQLQTPAATAAWCSPARARGRPAGAGLRDETELEAVRRARDTVLANISHEFRTPLAAQLASIELLREGLNPDSRAAEELVLSLERGTLRLTRLIDNLLESVRIESGQLDIRRQSLDLARGDRRCGGLVDALLRQRRQRSVDCWRPHAAGRCLRLTQVFVNLFANASKFAPERTAIRVGARRENQSRLGGRPGPGLPEATQKHLRAFRSRRPLEPAPGGMGLGFRFRAPSSSATAAASPPRARPRPHALHLDLPSSPRNAT